MTIMDVANALGVSKATVSRAITGNGRISRKTKSKVLNYMEKHDFHPNVIAQSLSNLKTHNIAFTIPGKQEFGEIPFFQGCLAGVCEKAAENGYDVLVVTVNDDNTSQMQRVIENRKVDGVILSRNVDNDRMINYLQEREIPFVLIGTIDNPDVVQIDNDHAAACKEITSLFANVHDKVGLIGGNHRHTVNQNRYKGFHQAIAPHREARVIWDAVDDSSIIKAFNTLHKEGMSVIFCMDDMICSHVLQYLNKMNINIPRDIEIVSFYNSWYLETHTPPIPSVYFNVKEQGTIACDFLLRMMSNGSVPKRALRGHELLHLPFVTK